MRAGREARRKCLLSPHLQVIHACRAVTCAVGIYLKKLNGSLCMCLAGLVQQEPPQFQCAVFGSWIGGGASKWPPVPLTACGAEFWLPWREMPAGHVGCGGAAASRAEPHVTMLCACVAFAWCLCGKRQSIPTMHSFCSPHNTAPVVALWRLPRASSLFSSVFCACAPPLLPQIPPLLRLLQSPPSSRQPFADA